MNNLQRIKAAWKIGWAATLEENGVKFQLLSKTNNFIVLREQESYSVFEWANFRVENMNIIGYLYAGQLAGNEPIPEGQRFRVKVGNEIGKIVTALKYEEGDARERIYCKEDRGYYASQVEPVF